MSPQDGNFSYHRYISEVAFAKLVEANKVVDDAWCDPEEAAEPCILCGGQPTDEPAIRLNNGRMVCKPCFNDLQHVYYPEVYQQAFVVYTVNSEARRIAREDYRKDHPLTNAAARADKVESVVAISTVLGGAGTCTVGLLLLRHTPLVPILGAALTALLIGAWVLTSGAIKSYKRRLESAMMEWDAANPEPAKPLLKQFHDPEAVLSGRDRLVLQVFDFWPGYPPFWDYVRSIVMAKDQQRCQVTGCPSRTPLHVHHIKPLSDGGSHRPNNLVTLCAFHHGLCPEIGHWRVWSDISTAFFTIVREHDRLGHRVRGHVRRLTLATEAQLRQLRDFHGMVCGHCTTGRPRVTVNSDRNVVLVQCAKCGHTLEFEQKLLEECGPWMAAGLDCRLNVGRWHDDSRLMYSQRRPVGRRRAEMDGRTGRPDRLSRPRRRNRRY